MANMVTRTFTGYNVSFVVLNDDGTTAEQTVYIAENNREKAVKKATSQMAGKGIFKAAERVEELRGIKVEDFYSMSVPVTRPPSQQPTIAE